MSLEEKIDALLARVDWLIASQKPRHDGSDYDSKQWGRVIIYGINREDGREIRRSAQVPDFNPVEFRTEILEFSAQCVNRLQLDTLARGRLAARLLGEQVDDPYLSPRRRG